MSRTHWWTRAVVPTLVTCLVGLAGVTGWLAWRATAGVLLRWQQHGALAFDDLVLCCAVLVLAVTFGWLGLGALLTLGTEVLRCTHTVAGRLARRMTPSLVRRLLAGACGAAVLTGTAVVTPATAAPADHAHVRPAAHRARPRSPRPGLLGSLPVPDRPTSRTDQDGSPVVRGLDRLDRGRDVARVTPHRIPPRGAWVRVRRGDTLWAIAARRLRPGARDADVDASWPVWFRHNRGRIGTDPDLIHPGTRLRVPLASSPSPRRTAP